MTHRERYLDYAKGVAILAMLLSHTMFWDNPIRTYISSFHMQFFFLVCGILFQKKHGDKPVQIQGIKTALNKRIRQLGVPYLVFCVLLTAFYTALAPSGMAQMVHRFINIVTLRGIDSLWFIPIYFFAEMLMYLVSLSSRWRVIGGSLSAVTVITVCLLSGQIPENPYLQMGFRILIGFSFVWLGRILEHYRLFERLPLAATALLLVIGGVLSQINGFSAMGSLEINNGILFFFNAAITSVSILSLCKALERTKRFSGNLLTLFGINTIVVLCTNNLLIESIRILDYKITGNWLLTHGLLGCFVFWLILIAFEALLIRLSEGRLGALFGRAV